MEFRVSNPPNNISDDINYTIENIKQLPYEIILYIFKYLNKNELILSSLVCRDWSQISSHNLFWKSIYLDKWPHLINQEIMSENQKPWKTLYIENQIRIESDWQSQKVSLLKNHRSGAYYYDSEYFIYSNEYSIENEINICNRLTLKSIFKWKIGKALSIIKRFRNHIALGYQNGDIEVWDLQGSHKKYTCSFGARIVHLVFNQSCLIVSGLSKSIKAFNAMDGSPLDINIDKESGISLFDFIEDRFIVFTMWSGIEIWDTLSKKYLESIKSSYPLDIFSNFLATSKQSSTTVNGEVKIDTVIEIWNWKTHECLYTLKENEPIVSLKFIEDKLISIGYDGIGKLWDYRKETCLKTFKHGEREGPHCITGHIKKLITAGKSIKVWDIETGTCLKTLGEEDNGESSDYPRYNRLDTYDNQLINLSTEGRIQIWRFEKSEIIK